MSVACAFCAYAYSQSNSDLLESEPFEVEALQEPHNLRSTHRNIYFGKDTYFETTLQALCTVGVAEIFDKTWFVAFMMSLTADRWCVFIGSLLGLLLHVVIAAGLGMSISQIMSLSTLNFIAAGAFFIMTCLYTRECLVSEPGSDIMAAGKEEAAEDLRIGSSEPCGLKESSPLIMERRERSKSKWWTFIRAFWLVFVAEWGDRTQIAMIGLHSSKPVIPVCVGSALAFLFLTSSAVAAASFMGNATLSERTVKGVSAASFLVFTVLAFHDGMSALTAERAVMVAHE